METVDLYFSNQLICFRGIMGILFQGEIHPAAIEIHLVLFQLQKKRKLYQVSCEYFSTCFSSFIIAMTIMWSPSFHNPIGQVSHFLLCLGKSLEDSCIIARNKLFNNYFSLVF